jgi:hypothetical protein
VGHLTSCNVTGGSRIWLAQGFWSFLKSFRRGTNANSGRALVFVTAAVHFTEAVLLGVIFVMALAVAFAISFAVLLGWGAQKLILKFSLWWRGARPGDLRWLRSCPPNFVESAQRDADLREGILVLGHASDNYTGSTDTKKHQKKHSAGRGKSRRPKYSAHEAGSSC